MKDDTMKNKIMPFAYFQKEIVPSDGAKVSIASNSLQYGTTCFAGIKGYFRDGKVRIFRLNQHHHRLMNASKILGMNFTISFQEFENAVVELVKKNCPETDFYLRPFIFAQDQQLAPKPQGLNFELAMYMVPMANYFDQSRGMRLMISSWRKFSDASLPTKAKAGGCYINSFLATAEATRCGYDEALVMDNEGFIVEASVANILVVYRDRLLMPELGSAQLEGVTMRTMIELLREEGLVPHFEKIDRSMIYTCNELILMGTAAQVSFADSVDGRKMASQEHAGHPGPICSLLRQKFEAILNKNHPKAEEWIFEYDLESPKADGEKK